MNDGLVFLAAFACIGMLWGAVTYILVAIAEGDWRWITKW